MSRKNNNKVLAKDVVTDAEHQFISQRLVDIFKDKPSKIDLEQSLASLKKEIDVDHAKYYDALINTPNAVQKISDVFEVIRNDDEMDSVFELIATRLPKEIFDKHEASLMHVTNADRKALNALIKFIKEGCADWNATESDPNYIRNKPTSLPADGGNAETLSGYDAHSLHSKAYADIVVGSKLYTNNNDDVDICVGEGKDNYTSAMQEVEYYINSTECSRIHFKPGRYELNYSRNFDMSLVITGDGYSSVLMFLADAYINDVTFRDIKFTDSEIHLKDNVKFDNCIFDMCDIILDGSGNNIVNCDFKECTIRLERESVKNIICQNKLSKEIRSVGGNNIIQNNIIG